jgi:DNA-binding NtrC family response regulator
MFGRRAADGVPRRQRIEIEMANQPHILVVEDDPLVSEVVMEALDGTYRTSGAGTAAAAMECLRTGGIDAMLLDCTLPGGLDPDLVPMADRSGVPVILMSGHPDMARSIPGAGADRPFNLTSLLKAIESVVPSHTARGSGH